MIDLSLLPMPEVVETLDFEVILRARKARYLSLYPVDQQEAVAAVLTLESEPVTKMLQENAYREMVLRQRINDAAKASLLAYANGTDLENRAADFGVERLVITPANPDSVPPTAAVMELDDALRYRAQLALEGLSVAGSTGAYEFRALSASANIAAVSVDSPTFQAAEVSAAVRAQLPANAIVLVCDYAAGLTNPLPGDVSLTVLPVANGTLAPASLVASVLDALSAEDVRPITDRPRAQLGQPVDFSIVATLELERGPSAAVVSAAADSALAKTIAKARDLEGELARSAIYAALHVPGVARVVLTQPPADILCDKRQYPNCTAINLTKVIPA
ncbi:baseplate J/gp47 family protein [Pseudomonas sp. UYIF39]|uniref:baseplate assembly protein n=1 Tax=Pseudomonas sp. UYIF39 TaxID=1630747 RepID=UPI00249E0B7A|nr:baseplate J/gp47 family protein [Pseudomonas sp. UYIF39]MDI3355698.1 baseplate J/gp47 family protein [Pseudomonas sp. UYIF39]